jgi:hypothetical protein
VLRDPGAGVRGGGGRAEAAAIHGRFTQPDHIQPRFSNTHTAVPAHHQEDVMQSSKGQFRIELTPEQKAKVRDLTGKDAEAVELSVEELEERIAPAKLPFKAGN